MKLPLVLPLVFFPLLSFADEPLVGTEYERRLATFGTIQTIAGRGQVDEIDDVAVNGWQATMEGGPGSSAELSRPHMAMADGLGRVYIADKLAHAIRRVDLDGTLQTVAGNGLRGDEMIDGMGRDLPLKEPNGLYTFPDGTTYILDLDEVAGSTTIRRLAPDGFMTAVFTDPVAPIGRGLWVSPDGQLIYYCAGTQVKRWTPKGGIEQVASGFSQLANIDVDPTGALVVTDRFAHRVYRIGKGGTRTAIAGNGTTSGGGSGQSALTTGLNEVRGVAFNANGSYYVCTHRDSQVWYVDTEGVIWLMIDGDRNDGTHAGDGLPLTAPPAEKISEPRGIAVAPNGDLLITENDRGFVRRVTNRCVPFELLSAERDETGVQVTWSSHREGVYRVMVSDDLELWDQLGITGGGGGNHGTFFDKLSQGAERRFYQVLDVTP